MAGHETRRVVGIDLGGTKLAAGVVDEAMTVGHSVQRPVTGLKQDEIVEAVVEAVGETRAEEPGVEAVGIGIPCLIDQRSGVAVMAVNLPIVDLPLRDILRERIALPVFVDNDANLATLAEQRHGAAHGAQDVVGLTIGTGIGGGLVLDGKLHRGHIGTGAELGHVTIDEDGPTCPSQCPNQGCLEAVASGTAIGIEGTVAAKEEPESSLGAAAADGIEITGELVTEQAQEGDEVARMVLGHVGRQLGVGLASFTNIFNPEVIVVGGGAIAAGDLLLEPAREELRRRALPPSRDSVRVVAAQFGPEAGLIGAAVLAFDGLAEDVGHR